MIDRAEATFIVHATLINGGYTYRRNAETPQWGYLVGGFVPEIVLSYEDFTADTLTAYADMHSEALSVPGRYLGTWINPDTNMVHVDVSTHVMFEHAARSIGEHRGELSIWDCHKREALSV